LVAKTTWNSSLVRASGNPLSSRGPGAEAPGLSLCRPSGAGRCACRGSRR
jgi:hypothetical protein